MDMGMVTEADQISLPLFPYHHSVECSIFY